MSTENIPVTELIPDFNKERYNFPVPDMPPVPDEMEPASHKGNWLWRHYDSTNHNYKNEETLEPLPPPLMDVVTPENPLEVDAYYSVRSPYSYLVLQRLTWLNSNYNCDVHLKVIFPVAVRTPGMFAGGKDDSGGGGGRWYKWADTVHDTARVGKYQGVPFRFADPDPVVQNHWPFENPHSGLIPPLEKQPYITWLIRLSNATQMAGKCLEFINYLSPLIWGGQSDFWPADVEGVFNKTGLDYQATIKDIQKNPEKVDAVWQENQKGFLASGHGGVPNMVFRGEPFFGQDRFDLLFWRLEQNGLTKRPEPRAPFTTKPRRWPERG